MIEILKKTSNNTADVVCIDGVNVGDSLTVGLDANNMPITKIVTEVFEQRKERGTYNDESKRRMWAKISF